MHTDKNWAGLALILLGMDLILIVALLFFVIMPPTQHFVKYTPPPSSESSSPLSTLYTPAASFTPEPSLTSTFYFTPSPAATPTFTPSPRPAVPSPTPTPHRDRKWIEVSLRQQKLVAYEDGKPVFEALVSTGLARSPTVTGRFRIYLKLLYSDMSGPGYYFRKVPYVMYFYRGYALHGTYWHNNFGRPMSRGCVNLRIEDARWLFNWTDPPLPPGASFVYSSPEKPGTLVIIYP